MTTIKAHVVRRRNGRAGDHPGAQRSVHLYNDSICAVGMTGFSWCWGNLPYRMHYPGADGLLGGRLPAAARRGRRCAERFARVQLYVSEYEQRRDQMLGVKR